MRPTVAVGLALGLILLVLAACPSGGHCQVEAESGRVDR